MAAERKATNITWHTPTVTKADREQILGYRGFTLWFTGLSGSGKSTLANAAEKRLWERGVRAYVLDGDNVRHGLNKDLGFSPEDRAENIRRIGEVAGLFTDACVANLTAFISPYRADRDQARALMADGSFIEVLVDCDVAECEKRDPKGLYKRARAGEIKEFTGISAPYEAPLSPEITVNTAEADVDACVQQILDYLEKKNYIPAES